MARGRGIARGSIKQVRYQRLFLQGADCTMYIQYVCTVQYFEDEHSGRPGGWRVGKAGRQGLR